MATVIDTLTLQLGLDPRQFVEGRREAEHALAQSRQSLDRFGQNVEGQGKKIGEVFSTVKAGAVGIVGAFVGGAAAGWIDNIMRMDASAGRLSKTIGIGIPNLSLWQELVKQVGGDASEAGSALGGMRQAINDMIQGGGALPVGAAQLLNQIGGWQGKTPDQILEQLVDHFDKEISSKRMTFDQAATFLRRLPGMTEGVIAVILKGRDAFDAMAKSARETGLATNESAAQAGEYVKQEALLIQQLHDIGRLTFPGITSGLKEISESFRALGGFIKENGSDWSKWWETLTNIFTAHIVPGGFLDRVRKYAEAPGQHTWSDFLALFGGGPKALLEGTPAESAIKPAGASVPPAGKNEPAGTATGAGATPYTAKPGAGQTSLLTDTLAQRIQGDVSGVNRFTAFNDPYHAFLGGSHPAGRGLDFTIKDPAKSAETAEQVRQILREMGLKGTVIDEYKRKSSNWTGGHIHVQVDKVAPEQIKGISGAPATGAPAAAGASPGARTTNTNSEQHSSVNINTLNVNAPKATDAHGIARDMEREIRPLALAAPFNFSQQG